MFDNIFVYNYNSSVSGDVSAAISRVNVSPKFGPQDRNYAKRLEEESGQRYQVQLPEIAILLKSMRHAPNRASGSNESRFFRDPNQPLQDLDSFYEDIQPTPYDMEFEIKIK